MSCWSVTVVFILLLPVANYSLSFYFNSAPKHWQLLQRSDMSVKHQMVMERLVKVCNNLEYVVTLLMNKFGWRWPVTFAVLYYCQTWTVYGFGFYSHLFLLGQFMALVIWAVTAASAAEHTCKAVSAWLFGRSQSSFLSFLTVLSPLPPSLWKHKHASHL